jgi:xanthine dehydrogenase accessory factor
LRILQIYTRGQIPVLIDPEAVAIQNLHPTVVIDARMKKQPVELIRSPVKLIIGLGPGFSTGENCHAVNETKRGHRLGRVIWQGSSEPDTGVPDSVGEHRAERVLRSPAEGMLKPFAEICDHLEAGQLICEVGGQPVNAPFRGVLRGLIHPSVSLTPGMKIGDLDPRDDPQYCTLVSDKSLAIAGGVIEAILSRPELRKSLWV